MKIIIDIPEEDYKTIIQRPKQCVVHWDIVDALRNGTPLDDVKAKIETYLSWSMFDEYGNETGLHKDLMKILDNIGKAENEDKE